jgi:biopolymer transport protein ExbB/TolQ
MNAISLSPLGLFEQAGVIGKAVMALLFCASIWCWILIGEGWLAWRRLGKSVAAAREDRPVDIALIVAILRAGDKAAATHASAETFADRRWRIGECMTRAARDLLLRAEKGLPDLAVISSVAPFVGLFGTVWGIMNAFAGIAEAKDTSLAVVAPGIAEALAATAYGLAAAIPASVGYNRLSALFAHVSADLDSLVQERADALASGCESASPVRQVA